MIQAEGLTKYYGAHAAIRDLTFAIKRGEVIGFLGLNGAGKTTTLRILGCVLLPTSGAVHIDGLNIAHSPHEVRRRIGFLPETPPLYNEMTVGDYLAFVARLRGVAASQVKARVAEVEERTATCEVHEELIASLSHGFKQRVGLAQAMVHKPALLILDEPSSGLDPVQIVEMRQLIRSLRGEHTILISSHILSEISQTCDRLLVIHEGELVAQGSEEELASRLGAAGSAIEIEVRGDGARVREALAHLPGIIDIALRPLEAGLAALHVKTTGELRPEVTRALVAAGIDVLRIDRGASQLESIFLSLTRAPQAEAPAAGQAKPMLSQAVLS